MLKAGTVVGGKYRLRHLIAEGGMAEVYLAEPVVLDKTSRLCALKRLLPALAVNPVFVEMFFKEALLSQTMSHKNIVRCHESFRDGKESYLVMEFVLGKEIGAWLSPVKDLALKERTKFAVAIGLSVCEALMYIHHVTNEHGLSGIVHGDISPQNIMIAADGCVKLYDFGAATTIASALVVEDDLVRGNLRYMSPEQLLGKPVDAQSDVFSLGLVLLEILCGGSLVVKRNQTSLNDGALWDPLQSLGDDIFINKQVREFFNKSLALHKDQRFSSCHEMHESLLVIAEALDVDDAQKFLSESMGNLSHSMTSPAKTRKSSTDSRYFSYLGLSAVSLGVFVWAIVAVFADVFEPKTRHNVPFWPTEKKLAAVALPPAVPAEIASSQARTLVSKTTSKVNKATLGTLSLKVKPWAEVFIDGKFFGSTPMAGLSLPEGEYLVQLRNPNVSAVALRMVKIYADKKTELIHNF